jgi:tripartite-type tricarboxylate transporter receptor subunit TctC
MKIAKAVCGIATACALVFASGAALAQAYPNKPVRIVVGFPPGAGTDLIARLIAKDLGDLLGQSVVVDNKPGAGGNIATEVALKAPADGYTLLFINSTFAANVGLFPNLGFDPIRDFTPVTLLGSAPLLIAASGGSGIDSLKAMVAQAKAKPNSLSYASCGNGGPPHIIGEQFMKMQGIKVTHIPYKGCGPATTDVVANQVPLLFTNFSSAVPFLASGKLKPLAVTLKKRSPLAPEIPTVGELGMGELDADLWFGLIVRSGVPKEIVERLNRDIVQVMSKPDIRDKLRAQIVAPQTSTIEQFDKYIRSEIAQYTALIKEFNIKVD